MVYSNAYNLYYATRALDGTWAQPALITNGVSAGVAMDAKGNAVAVFGVGPMYATRLPAGSNAWSNPVLITGPNVTIGTSSISANSAGTFLVGWSDGSYTNRKGNVAVSSMAAGSTSWKISYLGFGFPDISVAAAPGHAVALWDQYWSNPSALLFSQASIN